MSTQTTPIIIGPREGRIDTTHESDLQQALGKVLEVLSRRRWLFILPMLTGSLIVLTASLFVPHKYVATASFEQSDDVVISGLIQGNTPFSFAKLRESMPLDLAGYNAVSLAADQLGLLNELPKDDQGQLTQEGKQQRKAYIAGLASKISYRLVQNGERQDVIHLRYDGAEPELGEQVIARLMDNYVTLMHTRTTDVLVDAHEFYRKEAMQRKKRVARMVWEQIQFSLDYPGVTPSDPDVLDRQMLSETMVLGDTKQRRKETAAQIQAQQEYLESLKASSEDGSSAMLLLKRSETGAIQNPRWEHLNREIQTFEQEIADLRATRGMTDLHPRIVGLLNKIDLRQNEMQNTEQWMEIGEKPDLGGNGPTALETELHRVEIELAMLQEELVGHDARIIEHEENIKNIESNMRQLYERREHFMTLQQELEDAKEDLSIWNRNAEKLERVRVATSNDRGIQFSVISEAHASLLPEFPTLPGVFALAAGIGFALGASCTFLRELLDRSFRHPARVRQTLGIPVLETIGEIQAGSISRWFNQRRIFSAIAVVETVGIMAVALLVYVSLQEPLVYSRIIDQVSKATSIF